MIFASNMICEVLGSYLREKRLKADLSQTEVAQKLGYSSAQFLSNIERGLCTPPMPTLKKMMIIYKISAREMSSVLINIQKSYLDRELKSATSKSVRFKRKA